MDFEDDEDERDEVEGDPNSPTYTRFVASAWDALAQHAHYFEGSSSWVRVHGTLYR
jgi:hypothetical protein